jgi:5-methylthioadenosine/S-adenosylhomocysteine deaminase
MCIHAAESQAECALIQNGTGPIAQMYHRREIDWTPPSGTTVGYLDRLGVLTSNTLLVHGVQFAAEDREVIRRTGTAWVHCPKSNAKLANGVAPLHLIRESYETGEARIGLGSDSVASNNTVDMFEEMRFAVLIQRALHRRYEALAAREVVEMATIGSARALGLDGQVGSLEPGKRADITVVGLDHVSAQPAYDPFNALVYAASARDVVATYIDGEPLYREGRFLQVDLATWQERFAFAANKMRAWTPSD